MSRRLIVVANRLPVALKDGVFVPTSGGLSSALQSVKAEGLDFLWLGSLARDAGAAERAAIEAQLQPLGAVPVWMPQPIYEAYYAFANEVLWPTLHSFTGGAEDPSDKLGDADAYLAANAAFAAAVAAVAGPHDTVWVHDYHLFPLPQLLRSALPATVRIGYFLHVPFCASAHWRTLPLRERLLEGVLGADLVGFHTLRDVGHFASAVHKTVPAARVRGDVVAHRGRAVALGAFPIGIDPAPFVDAVAREQACASHVKTWGAFFAGRPVVVSCDRLDPIKGLEEKLQGFQALLALLPAGSPPPCLLSLVVPSRDNLAAYAGLKTRCDALAAAVNAAHGVIGAPPPITLLYRSLAHDELAALFAVGQVCLITSLRDGMNLVSFEYVAAQEGAAATSRAGGGPGVLVLSEFTGASQCLAGALTVQPRDAADVAEKLACALGMGAEERRARHAASWAWVRVATAGAWAASFLCALRERAAAPPPPPPPPRAEVAALWRRATRPAALLSASLLSFFSSEGHAAPAPAAAALASLLQRGARVALFSDGGAGALGTAFAAAPGALALVAEGGLEVRCAGGGAAGGAHALRGPLRPRLGGSAGAGDPGATQPAPHARAPSRHLQTVFQGSEEGAAVAAACDGAPPAWRCLLPADCLDPAWKPAVLAVLREAAGLACGSGVKETAYAVVFSVGDAHLEKFAWVAREAVEKLLELPPTEPALCVESRSRSVVVSPAKGGLRDAVAAVVAPDADFCVCLEDEESVMLEPLGCAVESVVRAPTVVLSFRGSSNDDVAAVIELLRVMAAV